VDLAIDTEPGQDDPASDEGSTWTPRTPEQPAGVGSGYNGGSASAFSPAPTMPLTEAGTSGPEAKTEPEPEAKTGPGPEAEDKPEAEAGPEPGAQALAEPGPEAENKPEAEAGPEAGADPASMLAASAQFDRMQSSPLPPRA
jgi:hypothetical protein